MSFFWTHQGQGETFPFSIYTQALHNQEEIRKKAGYIQLAFRMQEAEFCPLISALSELPIRSGEQNRIKSRTEMRECERLNLNTVEPLFTFAFCSLLLTKVGQLVQPDPVGGWHEAEKE
jgi:hypothetical protein